MAAPIMALEDLRREKLNFTDPWLAMGDFNTVLEASEISNPSNYSHSRSAAFAEWIFDQALVDVGYDGPCMTWKRGNSDATFKSARLDRALGDGDWIMRFQNASMQHLPMVHSDHSPLLMKTNGKTGDRHNQCFKFQAAWLSNEGLEQTIRDKWNPNGKLRENIRTIIPALEYWSKHVFGSIRRKKDKLLARLAGIQKKTLMGKHSGLVKLEKRLQDELDDVLYQEELHWYQKSREEWITSGDRNTHFYHMATVIRRARKKVTGMKNDNGDLITNKDELKEMMRSFFIILFEKDDTCDITLAPKGGFPIINAARLECMKYVSADDIKKAVKDMAPMKAPGPDGLHALFYQKVWTIVGESVVKMAEDFFNTGDLQEGMNDTYITLIPKVDKPERPTNFRPISLCNVSYKIITKAMANKLKDILKEVIGPNQSSFVPERQITDNILIYQEVLNTMKRKRNGKGLMAIKIDLEKAYDRLSWEFIKDTLEEVGMDHTWTRNIMACVETSRLSILWEGEQTEYFKPGRGIRQGDPISPYLFVLCMERLSHIIQAEVANGNWKGVKVSRKGPVLSHLFFADDMVLFSEADERQVDIVKKSLDRFCAYSGQKVSLIKSHIYFSNNVNDFIADQLESRAGIPRTKDLGRYLGVPSIHGRVSDTTFSNLLERLKTRLEGWKAKSLTLAGRHVLAQSVLSTIPYYVMQTAKLPLGLCDTIDKRIRQFIWGGPNKERSCSLVKWTTVTQPKHLGGLGIRNTRDMNRAFMTKLGWRMMNDENSLWSTVLVNKYMEGVRSLDRIRPKQGASNAWTGIVDAVGTLREGWKKNPRNGKNTRFWEDVWVLDDPLLSHALKDVPFEDAKKTVEDCWVRHQGWD